METRYKFIRLIDGKIRSEHGDCTWHVGEQQSLSANDELEICETGFHCSRRVYDAFLYVQGEILAEVEVSGTSAIGSDKEAWQSMMIIRAWKWQKRDSVALAIFAASLVLGNYERVYPDDDRPHKAIEAAQRWLASPTEENQAAAASAADSADSADSAARSAAWSAAWSAAEEISEQMAAWMQARIEVLEPYEEEKIHAHGL